MIMGIFWILVDNGLWIGGLEINGYDFGFGYIDWMWKKWIMDKWIWWI